MRLNYYFASVFLYSLFTYEEEKQMDFLEPTNLISFIQRVGDYLDCGQKLEIISNNWIKLVIVVF